MSLLVIAYPNIEPICFEWIQKQRSRYDQYLFQIVNPHFTIVFPVNDVTEPEFSQIVESCSNGIKRIEFEIKQVVAHEDLLTGKFLQFLIPEMGNDEIVQLHDQLYSGELKRHLRKDIPYIPHITIGSHDDMKACRQAVAQINATNFQIHGTIDTLNIVAFENNKITPVKTVVLQ